MSNRDRSAKNSSVSHVPVKALAGLLPIDSDPGAFLVDYELYRQHCSRHNSSSVAENGVMGNKGVKAVPTSDVAPRDSSENLVCDLSSPRQDRAVNFEMSGNSSTPPSLQPPNGQPNKFFKNLTTRRQEVGVKIFHQKPIQKMGILDKPDPLPALEKGVLCPHCGYTSANITKCDRCSRVLEKAKVVDLPPVKSKVPSPVEPSPSPRPARESFGSRRPRLHDPQTRQTRARAEEPQCVTLSSDEDEDDSTPGAKKLKEDETGPSSAARATGGTPTPDSQGSPTKSDPLCDTSSADANSKFNETDAASGSPMDVEADASAELARWKDGGLRGTFFAVPVRSARMGSYKFTPTERVLFSSEGIMIRVPIVNSAGRPSSGVKVPVIITIKNILHLEVHFSRHLSVIFLHVTPSVTRNVSKNLGLVARIGPYWDQLSPHEHHRRLTLLPDNLTDAAKNAIKQAFVPSGLYKELSAAEANRILVITAPPDAERTNGSSLQSFAAESDTASPSAKNSVANKENGLKAETRTTRSSAKNLSRSCVAVTPMFAWSAGPNRFSVTTEDYECLNLDNLLNDSIIDFYLQYVFCTGLSDDQREKCHVFSSFFYQRLTTRPAKSAGRKHPIEDSLELSQAEKRHSRVKSWTKKVDIFDKDYLIIPINEQSHWFLAIVCFAGLDGPVSIKSNKPVKLPPNQTVMLKKGLRQPISKVVSSMTGESFVIGNTTITPVGSKKVTTSTPISLTIDTDRDEAESEEDESTDVDQSPANKAFEITEPIKQPCILFFDSLAGTSHFRVAATLREYLMVEYLMKKIAPSTDSESGGTDVKKLFCKETMVHACLNVPQQNNSYDCGIYVLQYAESFMKEPLLDFLLSRIDLSNWFPSCVAGRKRKDIQMLLIQLTKEKNPLAEEVLKLLPQDDVRLAMQLLERKKCQTVSPLLENTTQSGLEDCVTSDSLVLRMIEDSLDSS